jgi:phosphonate metabolism-associated iron-containing alcohol dehydrogenase
MKLFKNELQSISHSTSIFFGVGEINKLSKRFSYSKIVLVTSPGFRKRGYVDLITKILGKKIVEVIDFVQNYPDIKMIDYQRDKLKKLRPDALLALGGGSVIDFSKALSQSILLPVHNSIKDLILKNVFIDESRTLPLIAIPTTSGTGSEVTPFATIWDFNDKKKYSLVSNQLLPKISILDPALTYGLPKDITVSSGLDSISHALESIWNVNANEKTITLATNSLMLSIPALRNLSISLQNSDARRDMMEASFLAGLAISKTKTALAHSISYPLTAHLGLSHGIACSFTLPTLLNFNNQVDHDKLETLAKNLNYSNSLEFSHDLQSLLNETGANYIFKNKIPREESVFELIDEMISVDRANNNIRKIKLSDIKIILEQSLKFIFH